MEQETPDPYFKNRLSFEFGKRTLLFDTASLLYSPHQIDAGSELLLQTLERVSPAPHSILVLNGNYGTVAVALAALYRRADVVACDKDLLALRYTQHNAALNSVNNITTVPGVGTRQLASRSFDLIVASIPTKIGDKVIEYDFILMPLTFLAAGRTYWFVAESQLNRLIPKIGRQYRLGITEVARQSGHIVYRITRP